MTDRTRFYAGCMAGIGGGLIVFMSARATWGQTIGGGAHLINGFLRILNRYAVRGETIRGSLPWLAILIVVMSISALLSRSRLRPIWLWCSAVAGGMAAVLCALPLHLTEPHRGFPEPTVYATGARWFGFAAGLVAELSALWGLPVAKRVQRTQLPVAAPEIEDAGVWE